MSDRPLANIDVTIQRDREMGVLRTFTTTKILERNGKMW